jgi:hypothetical protein
MGHAISGGGFYNIYVDPLPDQPTSDVFEAIIHFPAKALSAVQLSDELKALVHEMWDWQVTRLSETEFSVRFPSRAALRMSTSSGKLYLPLSQCDTNIREAFTDPKPAKALPSVWVRLAGVPRDVMTRERLMACMTMVGRPIDVDELSLKKWKTEPMCMRFQCRYPERIKGTVQLFVNGEPFTIGVQVELGGAGAGGGDGGPPKPPAPRDDGGDDEESEERSSDMEAWNKHR